MALPLGKLTILVGAGIVGSVLAKEGRLPDVSDFFSGAFKIALRQIRQDKSTSSTPKPRNDSLLQQVNSLRQELQLLASNRSVTIVTSSGSGSSRYTIIIVVVVMGYGYIWWKGWKLPEFMFATRRSLSDACGSVSKQLESVYTSISATKRHLASRIDRVDTKIDDCVDNTAATRDEVSEIRGKVRTFGEDVQSVHLVVQSLETKISRIEGRQNETNYGVGKLLSFARSIETSRPKEQIEAPPSSSSRPALELPSVASSARAGSLPPSLSVESSSPSASSVSPKRPLHGAVSASGLKELGGISDVVQVSSESSPQVSNAVFTSEQRSNENSGFGSVFGRNFAGSGASLLTRSRSAMQSFK
ncbi:hypothetical protein KY290_026602 [Solanum tuberosum]|uniref:DUF1664 domain-containing protein n=1 Tax=Solanum tuberosum TaxID=4113 RepID=A0ABQ7UWY0_SOLTU|nr:hypothetical protein KY284_025578 [Solanum tuberosum]KAH0756332.1 hypothetical protein KY290_026602 [Solanum tuberosum]